MNLRWIFRLEQNLLPVMRIEITYHMAYQSGLGSNDLIFALNYSYDQLGVGIGYQLAGERNENISKLKRGDDLLVRASYNFLQDKFTITPQILFIKRLGKSKYRKFVGRGPMESYIDVDKSHQTQVNLLTQFNIRLIIIIHYLLILQFHLSKEKLM
jgi:hypothetical protein